MSQSHFCLAVYTTAVFALLVCAEKTHAQEKRFQKVSGIELVGAIDGEARWGDYNGDGFPDLGIAGSTDDSPEVAAVLRNDEGMTFSDISAGLTRVEGATVRWGDYDEDGDLDLVVSGFYNTNINYFRTDIYRNDGDVDGDGRVEFTNVNADLPNIGDSVDWGDYDKDGDLDLVITGVNGSFVQRSVIYENIGDNDSDGVSEFRKADAGIENLQSGTSAWIDYDDDGDLDLLVNGRVSSDVSSPRKTILYRNDVGSSGRTFEKIDSGIIGVQKGSVDWGDYDGDGDPDLLLTGEDSDGRPVTAIYRNDETSDGRSFEVVREGLPQGGFPQVVRGSASWGDYDQDGDLDLVITGGGTAQIFANDDGSFSQTATLSPVARSSSDWADYDQDGDLDLIVTGRNQNGEEETTLYRNEPTGPLPPLNLTATPSAQGALGAENANGSTLLDWDASSSGSADRYNIYRSTEPIPADTDPSSIDPALTAEKVPLDGASRVDTSPALGQTYFYRITSVGSSGMESDLSEQASAFLYPPQVKSTVSVDFGEGSRKQDYRLIALPGDPPEGSSRSIANVLPGSQGTWRAFWDDGSSSNFLIEYDESKSETFAMTAGRGFWVLSAKTWSESELYSSVTLERNGIAMVRLHNGWNIVANPTGKDVSWSRIQQENGLSNTALWQFDGSFEMVETMRSASSGKAYYILNDENENTLKIPYPGSPHEIDDAGSGQSTQRAGRQRIALQAASLSGDTSRVEVQFAGYAEEGFGRADIVAPTNRFSTLSFRLENPSSSSESSESRQKHLALERRPSVGEGQTFDLTLRNRTDREVSIRASQIQGLGGTQIALLKDQQGSATDLRREGVVRVPAGQKLTSLRLLVGSYQYVDQQVGEGPLPRKIQLQIYPNPARQRMNFRYALPEAQKVRLVVYDVLGRKVKTLVQGQTPAGEHTAAFNVNDLAGGVYFGRLETEGGQLTRKVTVVK
jgi:hypothetical protein